MIIGLFLILLILAGIAGFSGVVAFILGAAIAPILLGVFIALLILSLLAHLLDRQNPPRP